MSYRAIKPEIGAIVPESKETLLSGAMADSIRQLLEDAGVIIFPAVGFTDSEQVAFARTLGDYVSDEASGAASKITIDPDGGISAEYTKASFYWHFDGYMNEVPILGSMLCCDAPSPTGGDTEFCNTYAAWGGLAPRTARRRSRD